MKTLKILVAVAFFAFLPFYQIVAQGVPLAISYQALLTDDAGDPMSPVSPMNFHLTFRVYDSDEGGTLLWSESQNVSVFQGAFSALLGTGDAVESEPSPQLDTVFDDSQRYLEITIADGGVDKSFSPRQRLVSAPFAFRSRVSEHSLSVADNAINTAQIADGSITVNKLADNSVSASEIQANAVSSSEVADNAIGNGELASGAVSLDELAEIVISRLQPAGSVTAWAGLPAERELPTGQTLGGIPSGWLLCDGSSVPTASYPELFSAIGYLYGGSENNFNLPDYRGYFLRGQAADSSQDPDIGGRSHVTGWAEENGLLEGSRQGYQTRSHNHENGSGNRLLRGYANRVAATDTIFTSAVTVSVISGVDVIAASGGNETRPKNQYVWYIIKAH